MASGSPSGDAAELARLRRLVGATIVATFVLILIGGIVRVSESGLGCGPAGSGVHGWPLCEGGLLPPGSAESLIEFGHRVVAGVVGAMILVIAWRTFRHLRDRPWLVRGVVAAGVLVLVQAALGGLTVERGLEDELVAAHLGLAMLLLGVLILIRRGTDPETERTSAAPPTPGTTALRTLTWTASALLLATIVAGGLIAGTERMGTGETAVAGAHMACGEQFPRCLGEFMPFGRTHLIDIHLTHRLFMYLSAIAVLAMLAVALVQRQRSRAYPLAGALLVTQILLGASNVWFGMHAGLIVGHLMLGSLLWSTVVYAGATLLPAPAAARSASARGRAATEAAA